MKKHEKFIWIFLITIFFIFSGCATTKQHCICGDNIQIISDIIDDLQDVAVDTPVKGFPLDTQYIHIRLNQLREVIK